MSSINTKLFNIICTKAFTFNCTHRERRWRCGKMISSQRERRKEVLPMQKNRGASEILIRSSSHSRRAHRNLYKKNDHGIKANDLQRCLRHPASSTTTPSSLSKHRCLPPTYHYHHLCIMSKSFKEEHPLGE